MTSKSTQEPSQRQAILHFISISNSIPPLSLSLSLSLSSPATIDPSHSYSNGSRRLHPHAASRPSSTSGLPTTRPHQLIPSPPCSGGSSSSSSFSQFLGGESNRKSVKGVLGAWCFGAAVVGISGF